MTRKKVENPKTTLSLSVPPMIYNIYKKRAELPKCSLSKVIVPILEKEITSFVSIPKPEMENQDQQTDSQSPRNCDCVDAADPNISKEDEKSGHNLPEDMQEASKDRQ